MTQTEFDMIRAAIKAAWPGYMVMNDKYSIRFWYNMLGHLELKVAEEAVMQLAATSKYPPQISDILQKVAEMNGAELEDPGEAWQLVMNAVKRYGSYGAQEAKDSLPQVVRKAVEQIGYTEICKSDNITAVRAHFFRIYETLRKRAVDEKKMPPMVTEAIERRLERKREIPSYSIGQHSENASEGILKAERGIPTRDITQNEAEITHEKRIKDIEKLRRRLLHGEENSGSAGGLGD